MSTYEGQAMVSADALRERLSSSDDYVAEARRIAGVDSFFSDSYREGLELYLKGVIGNTDFNDYGLVFAAKWAIEPLAQRLKIDDWIRRHPYIARVPVTKPVFVLGLPRTGSTILHALLGVDPRFRILWKWETSDCVPPVRADRRFDDPRLIAEQGRVAALRAKGYVAPHFVEADEPEECIYLMMEDLKALSLEHIYDNPGFRDWLLNRADMLTAYQHHKRALQLMQSEWPARWMLKLPSHALSIDALFATYPDARIIVPHRDPIAAAGSYCSLNYTWRTWLHPPDTLDAKAVGRQLYPQVLLHATRLMAYRDAHPTAPFLDVFYEDFKRDPLSQLRQVYEFIGEEFTPDVAKNVADFVAAHPEQPFGKHSYRLSDFGIERDQAVADFKPYMERYDISTR